MNKNKNRKIIKGNIKKSTVKLKKLKNDITTSA